MSTGGYIENWSGRCSFWCRTTLRSKSKDVHYERRYLNLKSNNREKKIRKKKREREKTERKEHSHTRKVSWPRSVARTGIIQRLIKRFKQHRNTLIEISSAHTSVIHPATSLLSSSQTLKKRTVVQYSVQCGMPRLILRNIEHPPLEVL